MTHGDSLARTVEATQRSLDERLGEVLAPHRDPHRPRDTFAATDAFLAATSRHLSAVEAVLVDQVRHGSRRGRSGARVPAGRPGPRAHHVPGQGAAVRRGARDPPRLGAAVGPGAGPARGPQPAGDPAGRRAGAPRRPGPGRRAGPPGVRCGDACTHPAAPDAAAPGPARPAQPAGLGGGRPVLGRRRGRVIPPRCARARTGTTAWWLSTSRFDDHAHLLDHHHRRRQDRARWAARSRTASPREHVLARPRPAYFVHHRQVHASGSRVTKWRWSSDRTVQPSGVGVSAPAATSSRAAFRRGLSRSTRALSQGSSRWNQVCSVRSKPTFPVAARNPIPASTSAADGR